MIPMTMAGPGSGYRLSHERRSEIIGIRDVLDQKEVLRSEAQHREGRGEAHRLSRIGRSAGRRQCEAMS